MEEKIFFNKDGVIVSNSRFVVRGQTYAMSGITSVTSVRNDPSRIGPIVLFFLAFIFLLYGLGMYSHDPSGAIIGGGFWVSVFTIWGVKSWRGQKTYYQIIFNSSSGRVTALTSDDEEYIKTVVAALNDAIVSRG